MLGGIFRSYQGHKAEDVQPCLKAIWDIEEKEDTLFRISECHSSFQNLRTPKLYFKIVLYRFVSIAILESKKDFFKSITLAYNGRVTGLCLLKAT